MKISDLSAETLEKIKSIRYDQILEKHEGPENWASKFRFGDPEFMTVQDKAVLLPIERSHHSNVTILRTVMSEDGKVLMIYLKDTTFSGNSELDDFFAGRIAICEKMPDEEFFIATIYHESFIVGNKVLLES